MKWIVLSVLAFLAIPAAAETSATWWKFWQDADEAVGASAYLFSNTEREVLNKYLRTQYVDDDESYEREGKKNKQGIHKNKKAKKQKSLPPGLQKKVARGGQLPPGWQKKVARGEVLDGDVYAGSNRLPQRILDRLPSGRDGTSIRQVDDRVVRIMDATGIILDVLGGQ